MATGINWCTETWNIVTGCTWVSPACDNCWAARLASTRLKHQERYRGLAIDGQWTGEVRCHEDLLSMPRRWRKPRVIFVCSTGDLFHPSVPSEFLWKAFSAMMDAQQHIFLVLTKRPDGIARMNRAGYGTIQGYSDSLEHVWVGVTAESQIRFDERAKPLWYPTSALRWPGHRFLSLEPLLDWIDLDMGLQWGHDGLHRHSGSREPHRHDEFDQFGLVSAPDGRLHHHHDERCEYPFEWVIAGCEKLSGGKPGRPAPSRWFAHLRDQCIALRVPFWLKQRFDGDRVREGAPLDGRQWLQAPKAIAEKMEAGR